MRRLVAFCLLLCVMVLTVAHPALAGINSGRVKAELSWSATTVSTNTNNPTSTANLFVRLTSLDGQPISYKGAEIDLRWTPTGSDDIGSGPCIFLSSVNYKTSSTCGTSAASTYLNRGSAVPVTVQTDSSFSVGWANTTYNTNCTAGNAIILTFDFSGCGTFDPPLDVPTSIFTLCSVNVLDSLNVKDAVSVTGGQATVNSGTGLTAESCNLPPVWSTIDPVTVESGSTANITLFATDPENGTLTYSAVSALPSGATLNGSTGAFSWTPSDDNSSVGVDTLTFRVTDDQGATADADAIITVTFHNHEPVIETVRDTTIAENTTLTLPIVATDQDGQTLTYSLSGDVVANMAINSATGVFTFSPSLAQAGTYNLVTLVSDQITSVPSNQFTITVTNVNQAPVVSAISDQTIDENALLTVTPSASDADGDVPTWSGTNVPSGGSVNASTGVLSWTPDFDQAGNYPGVMLTADDGNGGTGSASFAITVNNVNRAPSIASIADQTVADGVLLTVTPSASDPDGDALTFSLSGDATGASVDANTGVFTWTPAPSDVGNHSATITAEDTGALTASASFAIDVTSSNTAPVLDPIGDKTVAEDGTLTFTASATDAQGDLLFWAIDTLPSGAVFDTDTGDFSWSPDFNQAGSYPVTITVSDGSLTDEESFTITVTNTNRAPVVDAIANQTVAEGDLLSVQATATDPDGPTTLAWGVSNIPDGSINGLTGEYTWTPTFDQAGTYTGLTILAQDTEGATGSTSFDVTVTNTNRAPSVDPIADQTVAEGDLLLFTPSGSDADGDALAWSGNNLPTGATVDGGDGTFGWTPDFDQAGVYAGVQIMASDGTATTARTFAITVSNTNRAPVLDLVADQTIAELQHATFQATASDADGNALTFSESGLPPWASLDASTGVVTMDPTCEDSGTYFVTLSVTDNIDTDSQQFQLTVTEVNNPPAISSIPVQTMTEDDMLVVTPSATDPEGDPLTWSASNLPSFGSLDTGTGAVTFTTGFSDAGSYPGITLTASDGVCADASVTFTLNVTNVNRTPSMDPIADQTVNEGDLLTVTPVTSDPDADVLTFSGSNLPTGATVNASTGVFDWTPSFNQSGSYANVTIDASDGSASASQSFGITVNEVNQAPAFTNLPATVNVNEGATASFTPAATDADSDPLAFAMTAAPSYVTYDAMSNTATIAPMPGDMGGDVDFTVDDGQGHVVSGTLTVQVNHVPVLDPIADQSVAEGALLAFTPTASDPDGDALTWSGSNLPSGAAVNATTGEFTWTPDFTQAGAYTAVQIDIVDAHGSGTGDVFDITVTNTNQAPVVDPIADQTISEGGTLTVVPSATDPDGDPITWSGSNLPGGATVDPGNGTFTWVPSIGEHGVYSGVSLDASDGSLTGSATFTITVDATNVPPVFTAISNKTMGEGQKLVVALNATDANGDDVQFSLADITPLPASVSRPVVVDSTSLSDGKLSWKPMYNDGTQAYTLKLYATDPSGLRDSTTFQVTVNNNTTAASPPAIALHADTTIAEQTASVIALAASDNNAGTLRTTSAIRR